MCRYSTKQLTGCEGDRLVCMFIARFQVDSLNLLGELLIETYAKLNQVSLPCCCAVLWNVSKLSLFRWKGL